jgi:hypothetical protein
MSGQVADLKPGRLSLQGLRQKHNIWVKQTGIPLALHSRRLPKALGLKKKGGNMIKDFDYIKKQLAELAEVINSFKSEAVQLRIVELFLAGTSEKEQPHDLAQAQQSNKVKPKPRKRKAKSSSEQPSAEKRKKSLGGTGAVAILTQLAATDFFDTPKTINDILEHCKHNLARTFKANEFSGKLARMVRSNQLKREKNADNQYEYKKV